MFKRIGGQACNAWPRRITRKKINQGGSEPRSVIGRLERDEPVAQPAARPVYCFCGGNLQIYSKADRHAAATSGMVVLNILPQILREVNDNGKGFVQQKFKPRIP